MIQGESRECARRYDNHADQPAEGRDVSIRRSPRASSTAALGLQLQVPKCKLFIAPTSCAQTESIRDAAAPRQLECVSSPLTLKVTHGDDSDVTKHCPRTAQLHESFFEALIHPVMPVQVAFSLLRYCAVQRLSFMARIVSFATRQSYLTAWSATALLR